MFSRLFNRFIVLLLPLALFSSLLYGCSAFGGDGEINLNPNAPVTIVVWHYYNGVQKTAFDDSVKEFNETLGYEKGIIVEAISQGGVNELIENVVGAASGRLDAGSMPDIFGSYGDTALEILNKGLVTEIDNYLSEAEISEYEDSFIHEGRIGTDNLYVFPIAKSTESLMLNKTDFDTFAEGVKASALNETVSYDDLSTWEGILRVADIYYRYTQSLSPDNEGKAFMGIDALANYLIAGSKQLGQDLVAVKDGNVTINLDRNIMSKLWFTYYEPMVTGRFTKLGRFCSDDIKTGDSLCFTGSTASGGYFPTELTLENGELKSIEMLAMPMPVFENGDNIAISQGAGMVIVKSEKEREYASALFLKWFTETERNVLFSLSASYLPVKKDALDEQRLNEIFSSTDSGDIAAQNSVKALKAGIGQIKSHTLYSSDVFDGSADFRNTLPAALEAAAREDRAAYLELIANGADPEAAYSEVLKLSGDKFDKWLDSLQAFQK